MKKIFILLASVMFSFMLSAEETPQKSERFYFFYSESCPHCHEAMPFVEELEKEFPNIEFKKLELSKAPENMAIFNKKVESLGIKGGGLPTFVFRNKYVVGFKKGVYEEKIRAMIGHPVKKEPRK
ncbi:thioredoxin family protein [bacterium]|nr:thioredoxin family protein [bacterium]